MLWDVLLGAAFCNWCRSLLTKPKNFHSDHENSWVLKTCGFEWNLGRANSDYSDNNKSQESENRFTQAEGEQNIKILGLNEIGWSDEESETILA